jgi:hypothetical protein
MFRVGVSKEKIFVDCTQQRCSKVENIASIINYPWHEIWHWDNNVTLRDLFNIMDSNVDLWMKMTGNGLLPDYMEEFHAINQSSGDLGFSYIELYWITDLGDYEKCGIDTMEISIGISGIDSSKKVDENGIPNKYGLDFLELSDIIDIPIRLNDKFEIYDNNDYEDPIINAKKQFTVIEVFWAIIWELTFYGTPKERNATREELIVRSE